MGMYITTSGESVILDASKDLVHTGEGESIMMSPSSIATSLASDSSLYIVSSGRGGEDAVRLGLTTVFYKYTFEVRNQV